MKFEAFLRQVQERGGFSSRDDAQRAVTATLESLRATLANGSLSDLPPELQHLISPALTTVPANQGQSDRSRNQTNNPQIANETRAASGGESTPESGQ
jgi:uncharacterized protein (DUF2267 family)